MKDIYSPRARHLNRLIFDVKHFSSGIKTVPNQRKIDKFTFNHSFKFKYIVFIDTFVTKRLSQRRLMLFCVKYREPLVNTQSKSVIGYLK